MNFEPYPFEKLAKLLQGIKTPEHIKSLLLTIGEPQFATPEFIVNELQEYAYQLRYYPKTAGEECLKDAMTVFNKRSFNIDLKPNEIVPTLGTREVLFSFPQWYLHDKQNPVMAYPNPFYQIYEGAAIASRAQSILLPLLKENRFLPDIETIKKLCEAGKKPNIVILNSPNNPTASVMSIDDLAQWIELALKYDFVLINDECYNQIYFENAPASILNACVKVGNHSFKNCLAMNSISKRSNAPGLRSGFVAGDSELINGYLKYRTYMGVAQPLPLQMAATVAWKDEEHTKVARKAYAKNFEIAKELLGLEPSSASFYHWIDVGDGEKFAKELWESEAVQVLPGGYLSRNEVGKNYIRMALVYDEALTREAISRVKNYMEKR
ncbi:MAG: succinyldiaminopimelate transaminase [Pseudomonadota bacterium]